MSTRSLSDLLTFQPTQYSTHFSADVFACIYLSFFHFILKLVLSASLRTQLHARTRLVARIAFVKRISHQTFLYPTNVDFSHVRRIFDNMCVRRVRGAQSTLNGVSSCPRTRPQSTSPPSCPTSSGPSRPPASSSTPCCRTTRSAST